MQLAESNAERKELLHRLLDKDKPEPPQLESEAPRPMTPQHLPWRVRQQMLEQEDRVKAKLIKDRSVEIEKLEQEMEIK